MVENVGFQCHVGFWLLTALSMVTGRGGLTVLGLHPIEGLELLLATLRQSYIICMAGWASCAIHELVDAVFSDQGPW